MAAGNKEGILQVFNIKKRDVSHVFKTLPGKEVTKLELGGSLGEYYYDLIAKKYNYY